MTTEWKHPKENPPQDDSMVLVVRDWGNFVIRDYAHYEYGKFYFPYTILEGEAMENEYINVILWTELPELPENLKQIEL